MKILIDGRTIKKNPSGVGIWNLNLITQLLKKKDVTIYLILTKNCAYSFLENKNYRPFINKSLFLLYCSLPYNFVNFSRFIFEQTTLKKIIDDYKPDIYHATDSFGIPYFINLSVKTVLTIHDLIPFTPYREYLNTYKYWLYKISLLISLKKNQKIVAISDKTKDDILYYFPKIKSVEVIYNGINEEKKFSQEEINKCWLDISLKLGLKEKKFVFYYGGFGKRKNVLSLINIFSELKNKLVINNNTKLVLSGRIKDAKNEALKNLMIIKNLISKLRLNTSVIFLDYLDDLLKKTLLKKCLISIYLSLYEGFGLIPFEILKEKALTVFSKVGIWYSFKAKNPFIIEDINSKEEIIQKISSALKLKNFSDKEEYKSLIKFSNQFSWLTMAENYYQLYKNLIER